MLSSLSCIHFQSHVSRESVLYSDPCVLLDVPGHDAEARSAEPVPFSCGLGESQLERELLQPAARGRRGQRRLVTRLGTALVPFFQLQLAQRAATHGEYMHEAAVNNGSLLLEGPSKHDGWIRIVHNDVVAN